MLESKIKDALQKIRLPLNEKTKRFIVSPEGLQIFEAVDMVDLVHKGMVIGAKEQAEFYDEPDINKIYKKVLVAGKVYLDSLEEIAQMVS